jgi:Uma2 family endonuclease
VRTVAPGAQSAETAAFLDRRHALGQDLLDEVWGGVYHVAPASHAWHGYLDNVIAELLGPYARRAGLVGTGPFNLGCPDDYRVPDRGCHRTLPSAVWLDTAAVVVEVVSPDDETWAKFDFYFAHDVEEICIADPIERRLRWFSRADNGYQEADKSQLLEVTVADLSASIDWPRD